jgi:catechol 2,3-dioxygenase-like lactoylglutathione lyase family enzyme
VIRALHHAQITVPRGAEDAARRFFCDALGLREVPKPEALRVRGGFWLALGAVQIHVGTEDHVERRRTKAHLAFEVDDLAATRALIEGLGLEIRDGEPVPGLRRFECRDPFGNRLEFVRPSTEGEHR